jgi:hypothetical protein
MLYDRCACAQSKCLSGNQPLCNVSFLAQTQDTAFPFGTALVSMFYGPGIICKAKVRKENACAYPQVCLGELEFESAIHLGLTALGMLISVWFSTCSNLGAISMCLNPI